jgi:hypothetical protein
MRPLIVLFLCCLFTVAFGGCEYIPEAPAGTEIPLNGKVQSLSEKKVKIVAGAAEHDFNIVRPEDHARLRAIMSSGQVINIIYDHDYNITMIDGK